MNIEYNLGLVAGSIACLRPFLAAIGVIKSGRSETAGNNSSGDVPGDDLKPGAGHELTTIGGGPKWRRLGRRGASSRVQGESVLCTQMTTVGHGGADTDSESQADQQGGDASAVWQGQHGSTDRIVHTVEVRAGYKV